MNKGQTLADIFCGAGPLAVRAAKKGLYVIANDLNPQGY
jgi:tRNA (guanine37-N1)-methyltransferase